jgi:hypothetical protein
MVGHRLIFESSQEPVHDLACLINETAFYQLDYSGCRIPEHTLDVIFPDGRPDIDPRYASGRNRRPTACPPNISSRIGFLFLVLENTSADPLADVQLEYKHFERDEVMASVLDEIEASGAENLDKLSKLANRSKSIQAIRNHPTVKKFGPFLKPGEQLIWLSSVYRARADHFEERFLRPWDMPTRIGYAVRGKRQTEDIRLPRRHNTVPVAMPFGWYQQ